MRRAAATVLTEALTVGSRSWQRAPVVSPASRVQASAQNALFRTNFSLAHASRIHSPPSTSAAHIAVGRRSVAPCGDWTRQLPTLAARPASFDRSFGTVTHTSAGSAQPSTAKTGSGREFPDNVRVGVGVVILRTGPPSSSEEAEVEVLMACRAKVCVRAQNTMTRPSLLLASTLFQVVASIRAAAVVRVQAAPRQQGDQSAVSPPPTISCLVPRLPARSLPISACGAFLAGASVWGRRSSSAHTKPTHSFLCDYSRPLWLHPLWCLHDRRLPAGARFITPPLPLTRRHANFLASAGAPAARRWRRRG